MGNPWHVVNMDHHLAGPFAKRKEAVDWCRASSMDGRARPAFRRYPDGDLEFLPPADPDATRRGSYFIVTGGWRDNWPAARDELAEKEKEA